jgi:hypothetical protein
MFSDTTVPFPPKNWETTVLGTPFACTKSERVVTTRSYTLYPVTLGPVESIGAVQCKVIAVLVCLDTNMFVTAAGAVD